MDFARTVEDMATLSVDERIQLIEAVWTSITGEPGEPALTNPQRTELERRVADHRSNPDGVVSWDVVKTQALARASS